MTETSSSWQFWPSRLDNIERIENYQKADSISTGRYQTLQQLGLGGFSTVWLARDEKSDRLVSLKIITAEDSNPCNELRILQHLKERTTDSPACDHVLSLLDHFTFEGRNGCHTCLVSPIAGPDLSQISIYHNPDRSAARRRLRGALARKFAKQVTLAVGICTLMESPTEVCYTFGIILDFVLIRWLDITDRALYELLGSPVTDKVRLSSGELNNMASAPEYLVEPANQTLNLNGLLIKVLVDFSHSFMLQSPPPEDVAMTMSYCASEVYFDGKASAWVYDFEIRAGRQMFESFLGGSFEVIRQIVRTRQTPIAVVEFMGQAPC
ncbi:hypothetical protein V1522DRAFT_438222 [Lipomyces starkeyi]